MISRNGLAVIALLLWLAILGLDWFVTTEPVQAAAEPFGPTEQRIDVVSTVYKRHYDF